MKKRILQILSIVFLTGVFTSCEKCKDCEYKMKWEMEMTAETDELYQSMGYEDTQDYLEQTYNSMLPPAEELCDEDLEEAEAAADVTVPGVYSIKIECN